MLKCAAKAEVEPCISIKIDRILKPHHHIVESDHIYANTQATYHLIVIKGVFRVAKRVTRVADIQKGFG